MEDIFLPFHKGAGSIGTGIGLSIVDKVVRLYGGEIRAYNDDGACFEFTLPIISSQGP
jgi:signal transduction histidine kinase